MALTISPISVPFVPTGVAQTDVTQARGQGKFWIALSCIMALGLVLSYALGAPWYAPLLFFTVGLAPIFPLWRVTNTDQIFEKSIQK